MIELNKYKLIPGSEANAVWGGIKGDISKQTDLVEYVNEHGGNAAWGSITGNIEDQVDLQNLLGSYATESWVSAQGYLSSEALSGYATESWVNSQQFATQGWVESQSYITSSALTGYATESWVSDQNYINESNEAVIPLIYRHEGYLRTHSYVPDGLAGNISAPFFDAYGQCYVWNIGGYIYAINFLTPEYDELGNPHTYIYVFNDTTKQFEHVTDMETEEYVEVWGEGITLPLISQVTDAHFLWEDSQGRVYYTNKYQVNLSTGEFTEVNPGGTMGGTILTYNGSKNNIVKLSTGIYLIPRQTGTVMKFNEETQRFENYGNLTGYANANWVTYSFYYNNYLAILIPGATYTARRLNQNGTAFNWLTYDPIPHKAGNYNVDSRYIYEVEKNGETFYVTAIPTYNKVYRLDETTTTKTWVEMNFKFLDSFIFNANGVGFGQYLLGHGYNTLNEGVIPLWDFDPTSPVTDYGWDNSVETRLTDIETNLGTALDITNNILS